MPSFMGKRFEQVSCLRFGFTPIDWGCFHNDRQQHSQYIWRQYLIVVN